MDKQGQYILGDFPSVEEPSSVKEEVVLEKVTPPVEEAQSHCSSDFEIKKYRTGDYTLILGDSRHVLSDNNIIETSSIDGIVTSPPYYNVKAYDREDPNNIGNMYGAKYWDAIKTVMKGCYRVIKPGRSMIWNVMDVPGMYCHKCQEKYVYPEDSKDEMMRGKCPVCGSGKTDQTYFTLGADSMKVMEEVGFILKTPGWWEKPLSSHTNQPGTFPYPCNPVQIASFEHIIRGIKPGKVDYSYVTHEVREASVYPDWVRPYCQSVIWRFPTISRADQTDKLKHSAPFPEILPEICMVLFSFIGDTWLDPFVGSGTVFRAGRKQNRRCVGIELDRKNVAEIERRGRLLDGDIMADAYGSDPSQDSLKTY